MNYSTRPLAFDQYEKYEIPQDYSAIIHEYLNIEEDRIDEIESELIAKGNKIFHSNMSRSNKNLFNVEIITGNLPFTF